MSSRLQRLRAAGRRESQRLSRGHEPILATQSRVQHRRARLGQQVARVVGGAAVDAEADGHAALEHLEHRRGARSETHVRARAVRDRRAAGGHHRDVRVVQMNRVGHPHVPRDPAELREPLDRPHLEVLGAVLRLFGDLRHMGVERDAVLLGQLDAAAHQLGRADGHAVGAETDAHHRSLRRIVVLRDQRLHAGEDRVRVLDELGGTDRGVACADVDGTARRLDADAELAERPRSLRRPSTPHRRCAWGRRTAGRTTSCSPRAAARPARRARSRGRPPRRSSSSSGSCWLPSRAGARPGRPAGPASRSGRSGDACSRGPAARSFRGRQPPSRRHRCSTPVARPYRPRPRGRRAAPGRRRTARPAGRPWAPTGRDG